MKTSTSMAVLTGVALLLGMGQGGRASQVALDVSLANPVLLSEGKQVTYLKVGLTGFEMKGEQSRAPANVVIVLDKSGSMQGEKIDKAKEAALMVLDKLQSSDIVSVVAYDQDVTVLVPATKASDKATIRKGIHGLTAGGSTALFAGVCKGAAEARKFASRKRTNRVILLSDGLANVGPDSPGELGSLGASLAKEGITVTTIGLGLGYNEDLMTQLAQYSDGNSYFAETSKDMVRLFNAEFDDVLSVVAQEVVVKIELADGVRPVRTLGRDADIAGQTVTAGISQLYSSQEKYVLLEVEVAAGGSRKAAMDLARVSVSYANMETMTTDRLSSDVAVRFSNEKEAVAQNVDKNAMIAAVTQIATERNKLAVQLRDSGNVREAQQLLLNNSAYLKTQAEQLESADLDDYHDSNFKDAQNLDEKNWGRQRKSMRAWQFFNDSQQTTK